MKGRPKRKDEPKEGAEELDDLSQLDEEQSDVLDKLEAELDRNGSIRVEDIGD